MFFCVESGYFSGIRFRIANRTTGIWRASGGFAFFLTYLCRIGNGRPQSLEIMKFFRVNSRVLLLFAGLVWITAGANVLRVGIEAWRSGGSSWPFGAAAAAAVFLLFYLFVLKGFISDTRTGSRARKDGVVRSPFSISKDGSWWERWLRSERQPAPSDCFPIRSFRFSISACLPPWSWPESDSCIAGKDFATPDEIDA